jgi:DNA end-binding protein Ku
MLLTTIKWPDEIRQVTELDLPKDEPEFKPAERKMAEQLVAAMTSEFNPEDYRDEYREALLKVIEAKVEGKETFEAPEQDEPTNLVDLMAALEASVAATKKARDGKERPVSVAEARERSTERGKAKTAAPAARKRAADEEEAEEARPARRRKSA